MEVAKLLTEVMEEFMKNRFKLVGFIKPVGTNSISKSWCK